MKKEYDLSKLTGKVRGKYAESYRAGHTVEIHKKNGRSSVQYFLPQNNAVLLDPDVQKFFPDSATVNTVLRSLMNLIPDKKPVSVLHR